MVVVETRAGRVGSSATVTEPTPSTVNGIVRPADGCAVPPGDAEPAGVVVEVVDVVEVEVLEVEDVVEVELVELESSAV